MKVEGKRNRDRIKEGSEEGRKKGRNERRREREKQRIRRSACVRERDGESLPRVEEIFRVFYYHVLMITIIPVSPIQCIHKLN